jgi:hypothetical protein
VRTGCTGELRDSAPRVYVRARAERRRHNGVGADGEPELGVRSSEQGQHNASKERARCGRQQHLQESTGSARWPALKRWRVCAVARAGSGQHTISELTRLGRDHGSKVGRHSKRGLRCSPHAPAGGGEVADGDTAREWLGTAVKKM